MRRLFFFEALALGVLDMGVVIDESGAECRPEGLVGAQRSHRFAQRLRQQCRSRLIGRVGRRAGIELPRDAVKAGAVSDALDIDEVAGFFVSSIQGALLLAKAQRCLAPVERFERLLFAQVLR